VPRLVLYHLHYFTDIPSRASDPSSDWLRDVLLSWISSNPPGTRDAWDPYPTSLRIVNWIKWMLLKGGVSSGDDDIVQSLAVQTRHLERNIEHDLSANHLLANATALTASGLYFGSEEGDRWLEEGLRLFKRELPEQVLGDGGHYERSPMYHAIVLEQLLDVLNVLYGASDPLLDRLAEERRLLESTAASMQSWLELLSHPDGEMSFFNDSTMGVALRVPDLRAYCDRLGLATPVPRDDVVHLTESGYFRITSEDDRTLVLFDAGPVGPDHQPGHGHCDALSFELSRDGRRVFVNSGISTYERGEERLRQRRTAAHNTVTVDGADQCELWGSHRCGRRHGILSAASSGRSAEAGHSGFAHLNGSPLHRRTIEVLESGLNVRDGFDGEEEHELEWSLRVHPDIEARRAGSGVELTVDGEPLATLKFSPDLSLSVTDSSWHPGFNLSLPCPLITASWRGRLPAGFELKISWSR